MTITVTTEVHIDGTVREYFGEGEKLGKARFFSEKKARAYLRRKGLTVKMSNVVKTRCPDCETKTVIEVIDLDVPDRQEIVDDNYDFLLSSNWNM